MKNKYADQKLPYRCVYWAGGRWNYNGGYATLLEAREAVARTRQVYPQTPAAVQRYSNLSIVDGTMDGMPT